MRSGSFTPSWMERAKRAAYALSFGDLGGVKTVSLCPAESKSIMNA